MEPNHDTYDVLIAGGGLAGLTATLALARAGFKVLAVAPSPAHRDGRTTAILDRSLRYLDRLAIGAAVRRMGAPLATMRLVDATGRLVQAPPVTFQAGDIGLEAFGYNLENAVLADLLRDAAEREGAEIADATVMQNVQLGGAACRVQISDGRRIEARIIVGADGRRSVVREGAAIGVREWRYRQSAVVLNFSHQLPHNDASTEFHTRTGPFTIVPLHEKNSSLVWVVAPEEAKRIANTDRTTLARMIEDSMQSMLGRLDVVSEIQTFPLSGMVARRFGAGNVVLVGEAAHVMPPIGAQGFNLGVRDIETLDDLMRRHGDHLEGIGERYHRRRIADIGTRSLAVHAFNRSLLADFLPVQIVRSAGLGLLGALPVLKRMAMREGLAPNAQAEHLLDSARAVFEHRDRRPGQPR